MSTTAAPPASAQPVRILTLDGNGYGNGYGYGDGYGYGNGDGGN